MKTIGNRGGFTLLEMTMSLLITVLILLSTGAMLWATLHCYNSETAQSKTDNDAVLAAQMMINDIREAKTAAPMDSGQTLKITMPVITAGGYYDRSQADTTNPIYYYQSDSTGAKGIQGKYLWRVRGSDVWKMRADLDYLLFEQPYSNEVKITIRTKATIANGYRTTQLTHRVVFMRNY